MTQRAICIFYPIRYISSFCKFFSQYDYLQLPLQLLLIVGLSACVGSDTTTLIRSSLQSKTTPTPSMFTVLMNLAPSYLLPVDHCLLDCGATMLASGSEFLHSLHAHLTYGLYSRTTCMSIWHISLG